MEGSRATSKIVKELNELLLRESVSSGSSGCSNPQQWNTITTETSSKRERVKLKPARSSLKWLTLSQEQAKARFLLCIRHVMARHQPSTGKCASGQCLLQQQQQHQVQALGARNRIAQWAERNKIRFMNSNSNDSIRSSAYSFVLA